MASGIAPVLLSVEQLSPTTLLKVASQGKLKDPAVLEQQVKRMLADPKSEALVDNFAEQWLFLRNLKNSAPNLDAFPISTIICARP